MREKLIIDSEFKFPVYKSKVFINKGLCIDLEQSRPTWWWRMWQYLFLGFKWVKIDD